MPALDRASDLQARMPSYHVCSSLALPALPQFLNQEPLRPQQLGFPDLAMMPHLKHTELMVVVVMVAGVYMWTLVKTQRGKTENLKKEAPPWSARGSIYMELTLDLHLQACAPSDQL